MRMGFSPLTAGLDYPTAFDLAAELGLWLEIAYDQHEMDPRLPSARELAEMGRVAGVGFTLHLPFVDLNSASLVPLAWKAPWSEPRPPSSSVIPSEPPAR